jgi:hypothetical protein
MPDREYRDDPSITASAELWRRIPPWHCTFDENLGRWRPSTAAFEDHPDGSPMSVVLADDLKASGRGTDEVLAAYPDFALAAITAGLARECGQIIARDPLEDEPAHAVVVGSKSRAIRKRFSLECRWVVLPKVDGQP